MTILTFTCDLCNATYDITMQEYNHIRKFYASNLNICQDCLQHYIETRVEIKNICKTCGCEYHITPSMAKTRDLRFLYGNECKKCAKQTSLSKTKETCLQKYGVDNPSKAEETKEKIRKTFIHNYGVDNPSKSEKVKEKIRKTFIHNYGVPHPSLVPEIVNKRQETFVRKYGMHPMKIDEFKQKTENTCIEKYGVKHTGELPERIEKTKETNLIRYGAPWYFQSNDGKEHLKNHYIGKYGYEYPTQVPSIRKKIAKSSKKSRLEKVIEEMLRNRNIEYESQYTITQNNITHAFDFAIFLDKEHNQLAALVDADGIYYHSYLSDSDGKTRNSEYYDAIRTLCIPENIKFIVIFEKHIEDGFRELLNSLSIDYDEYINDIFTWCRSIGFPWYQYTNANLIESYDKLKEYDTFYKNSLIGMRIIRHFHKSILTSRRYGCISPYDAYNDNELLLKCIKNRFIYKNNLEPSRILEGFTIAKIAPKVSVFRPTIAKMLIKKYLNSYDTIFDPFSGFSGRMLGTCSLNKKYIGQDLNDNVVKESNEIIQFLKLNAEVTQKDIFESCGEYECLFTCSPYSNKEIWNNETIFKTCDEWIDECIKRFRCKEYLFVVDNTKKYKDYIVETLTNKSHFGKNNEYVILIQK